MDPSLYVHIPLCLKKCDYCDFFSVTDAEISLRSPSPEKPADRIVARLAREIADWRDELAVDRWKTVYVGGGTPSLLSPANIVTLCEGIALGGKGNMAAPDEWTIEANPEDIGKEWLDACAHGGIDRLSLGIQSLDDFSLAAVGRRGSARKTIEALELIKRDWKGLLSVDLIAGLPGQTSETLISDLERIAAFAPDHVSLYSLTVEDETPLGKKVASGRIRSLPDGDDAADIWIRGRDWLEKRGWRQYEVSNFAKAGRESRHNMTYWRLEPYVGAGPGATGTVFTDEAAFRYTNGRDIESWLRDPRKERTTERISREELRLEALLMGMRLADGIERRVAASRFGADLVDLIPNAVAAWSARGLLLVTNDRIALTREGLLFLNRFLEDCARELY
jgi:oxygen-independent coproporphyrinogen-3 oxidase